MYLGNGFLAPAFCFYVAKVTRRDEKWREFVCVWSRGDVSFPLDRAPCNQQRSLQWGHCCDESQFKASYTPTDSESVIAWKGSAPILRVFGDHPLYLFSYQRNVFNMLRFRRKAYCPIFPESVMCNMISGCVVCNMISAVHSDKSKSNSSVILGVIGQHGGGWRGGTIWGMHI